VITLENQNNMCMAETGLEIVPSTVASATNISSLVTKNSGLLIIIEKTTMLKPVRDNLSLYMYVV